MLKIRDDAWHYRIWKAGRRPSAKPKNLCLYFWATFFRILIPLIIGILAATGIVLLAVTIFHNLKVSGLVTLGLALFVAMIAFVVWIEPKIGGGRDARKERARAKARERAEARAQKEPSVLWEFLKAKKAKYCPMIEVVDSSKSEDGDKGLKLV